ncbi:endonuclease/exonuclease/phosphatase family protein [uncultured Bartonella sp.]|uniref:endonuclease/exonuclease/phosphatase family protein n=1 Tax=uncultured Bartonella sp. TaxID=104108 RepID=UPI002639E328|nr:endonuclease/exonuclease/phosphatase family protein [uncultured Bartonella sp.]
MIEILKNKKFHWPSQLNQKALQNKLLQVIRNRNGHRPKDADRDNYDMVVGSYNVHKCVGVDNIFDPARIIHVVAELDADIMAFQEADKRFGERVGLLDLDLLKSETGLIPVPINTMSPLGHGWHGNALFFRNGKVNDIVQINLPGVEPRGALIVELEMPLGLIRIVAAHFGLLHHSRIQQAKLILSILEKRKIMPTIMVGDLNEWRIGKTSSLKTLSPFFDVRLGTLPSFPSRFPVLALDRVFAYPHELVSNIEIHTSPLARVASDHLPIKAEIDLEAATKILKDMENPAR